MPTVDELLRAMPPKVLRAYQMWEQTGSTKQVAELFGVNPSTIRRWKKKWQWEYIRQERLRKQAQPDVDDIDRIIKEQKKIVRAAILTAVKQLQKGELKARSFADLIALLRYQRELEGDFGVTEGASVGLSLVELHEELERRRKAAEAITGGKK